MGDRKEIFYIKRETESAKMQLVRVLDKLEIAGASETCMSQLERIIIRLEEWQKRRHQ